MADTHLVLWMKASTGTGRFLALATEFPFRAPAGCNGSKRRANIPESKTIILRLCVHTNLFIVFVCRTRPYICMTDICYVPCRISPCCALFYFSRLFGAVAAESSINALISFHVSLLRQQLENLWTDFHRIFTWTRRNCHTSKCCDFLRLKNAKQQRIKIKERKKVVI
jgi:hypothetical protein